MAFVLTNPFPQTGARDFDQGALKTPMPGLCCGVVRVQGTVYALPVNPVLIDVPCGTSGVSL